MSALEDIAREWVLTRREAITARAERNRYRCPNEEDGGGMGPGSPPCWRTFIGDEALPRSAWCDECLERQRWHETYLEAVRRRGNALRRLIRLAESAA